MPERTKSPVVPLAVAVVALLVLIGVLVLRGGAPASDAADSSAPAQRDGSTPSANASPDPFAGLARRDAGDAMARGDVDAPVVMISYSEFQCPFCGKFARDTEPALVKKYVTNGTLRIEWRDFPYLGPESDLAARAGRAAGIQGKFWQFHDAMYAHQLPPNSGRLTEDHLVGVARSVGLSPDRFRADLESEESRLEVQRDFDEGRSIGVTGTPAFIINGQPVIGAQPLQVFEQVIEKAAAEAKQ